jgi:hypothetical protein
VSEVSELVDLRVSDGAIYRSPSSKLSTKGLAAFAWYTHALAQPNATLHRSTVLSKRLIWKLSRRKRRRYCIAPLLLARKCSY